MAADFVHEVDAASLHAAAVAALEAECRGDEAITLVVADDAQVQELNGRYRGLDEVTDVLAFPAKGPADDFVLAPQADHYLGDVIIAYPRASAQAESAGHSITEELCFLVVHGTLHLLGYDHTTASEEAAMQSRQGEVLASLAGDSGEKPFQKVATEHRSDTGATSGPMELAEGRVQSPWRSGLPTSLRNALIGLGYVLRTQRNARIHLAVALVAVALAAVLSLSWTEWAILAMTIGSVFVAEMFNSVAEAAVDAVTWEFHPLAKAAKDVAAGAVICAVIVSVIVGLLLFGPRLWALGQRLG